MKPEEVGSCDASTGIYSFRRYTHADCIVLRDKTRTDVI
jgi:hypothetical protein